VNVTVQTAETTTTTMRCAAGTRVGRYLASAFASAPTAATSPSASGLPIVDRSTNRRKIAVSHCVIYLFVISVVHKVHNSLKTDI